jgi:hypothetical protein
MMDDSGLRFFDGLLWYLEIRNWAFEKIAMCPHGSPAFDVRTYHALYFVNLLSAVEHVQDYCLEHEQAACLGFTNDYQNDFGDTQNLRYARELRNAVIHRGLDPSAAGHSDGTRISVLCPAAVPDRKGKNSYSCTFKYMLDLAAHCNAIVDPAITEALDKLGFFDPARHRVPAEEQIAEIDGSAAMPEWAKQMAKRAFEDLNYSRIAADLAASRISKMRRLLGQPGATEVVSAQLP